MLGEKKENGYQNLKEPQYLSKAYLFVAIAT
jgi:hypothetical protein